MQKNRPNYAQFIREKNMRDQLNKGKHAIDKQHKEDLQILLYWNRLPST